MVEKNAVSFLQELSMKYNLELPDYQLIFEQRFVLPTEFIYMVTFKGLSVEGAGKSKKKAKIEAAEKMVEKLREMNDTMVTEAKVTIVSNQPKVKKASAPSENWFVVSLNEYCESVGLKPPGYKLVHQGGPPHNPTFTYMAQVMEYRELGESSSKKVAKHVAAEKLLNRLKLLNLPPLPQPETQIEEEEIESAMGSMSFPPTKKFTKKKPEKEKDSDVDSDGASSETSSAPIHPGHKSLLRNVRKLYNKHDNSDNVSRKMILKLLKLTARDNTELYSWPRSYGNMPESLKDFREDQSEENFNPMTYLEEVMEELKTINPLTYEYEEWSYPEPAESNVVNKKLVSSPRTLKICFLKITIKYTNHVLTYQGQANSLTEAKKAAALQALEDMYFTFNTKLTQFIPVRVIPEIPCDNASVNVNER